jgi:hypothetical protein
VAESDCNAAPQLVASMPRRAVAIERPSAESVVERMREQGWEHSARLADAIAAAAAAPKAAAGRAAAVPEPPSPPSVYSDDGMETGASSQRTSWSSWHRTKTPKLDMNFSFEHLPAALQANRGRF